MAEWKISNDLPYLDEFPTLYQLSEYPNTIWHQVNGELPYKTCFPPLYPPKKAFIPKKYKTYEIKLYDYMHDVVIRKDVSK